MLHKTKVVDTADIVCSGVINWHLFIKKKLEKLKIRCYSVTGHIRHCCKTNRCNSCMNSSARFIHQVLDYS